MYVETGVSGLGAVEMSAWDGLKTNKPPAIPKCMKPADIAYVMTCMKDAMAGKAPVKDTPCYWLQTDEKWSEAVESVPKCPGVTPAAVQKAAAVQATDPVKAGMEAAGKSLQRMAVIGVAATAAVAFGVYWLIKKA